jgi:hypothetical protein
VANFCQISSASDKKFDNEKRVKSVGVGTKSRKLTKKLFNGKWGFLGVCFFRIFPHLPSCIFPIFLPIHSIAGGRKKKAPAGLLEGFVCVFWDGNMKMKPLGFVRSASTLSVSPPCICSLPCFVCAQNAQ